MPFIFKLAANLLLEFVCSHVYSQHEVVNEQKYSSIQIPTTKMHFNSHMELDLCFKVIDGSLILYASLTNEILGQRLSNYSRYAANLNRKSASFFFYSPL